MKTFQKILIIVIVQLLCIQQTIYAQDTTTVDKPVKHKFEPETLKATMLAVAFPGLGQIYNRKILKIPAVYAGFGVLFYLAGVNSKYYNKYMKAYQDFTDKILETNSYLQVIDPKIDRSTYDIIYNPGGNNTVKENYSHYKEAMLQMVDTYKRYRDLSYIGIAGWYLISILDANVDASLFNYDISPNLDITLVPMQMSLPGGYFGAGLSVNMTVNF